MTEINAENHDSRFEGVIHYNEDEKGCELTISVLNKEADLLLIPIGLSEVYWSDGLKIKFNYHLSKANMGTCSEGRTVILKDIEIIN